MFYSETLLSKTGPLARVWLSANLERKLNKSNILQTNLEDSVNAIMDQGQAPMALRLSGQLLLGVARIYSRKARYLMDDCNEALVKIKMAFRPGNNLDLDLAAINPEIAAPNTLMPDTIAGDIPTIPILDESLFSGGKGFDLPNLDDPLNWTSQLISSPSIELDRRAPEAMPDQLYEEDLGIDLGLGDDMDMMSIEKDRRAEPEKSIGPDSLLGDGGKIQEDDLGLDLHMDDDDSLLNMNGNADQMDVDPEDMTLTAERLNQERAGSVSSLSSARSSIAREADNTFLTADAEDLSTTEPQPQPAMKKRKILPVDEVTEIKQQQIKEQQADRSAIIRAPSMLPKDPVLLALMEMQRKGLFVSSIMGDGRSKGWAPELRGILSIEVIRKNAGTKRKRREVEAEVEREPSLQLEIPADDSLDFPTRRADLTADDSVLPALGDEEDEAQAVGQMNDTFDETTIPLVHPEDQGPISQGTHHAVHLLRDHFGGDEQSNAATQHTPGGSKQQRQHVMFQNIFPESRTTKVDATKMFFEVLVLATKDAIKVEQPEDRLGGPIKIRAKRGLWGTWAEEKAGGEAFGTQAETEAAVVA